MRKSLAALVFAACQIPLTAAAADQVWVFTASGLPAVPGLEQADKVFVLNGADADLRQLRFPNPGSEEEATRIAMERLQSPAGQTALARVRASSEALFTAWLEGIDKLPAVLVDQKFVIYGPQSVSNAVRAVEDYRRGAQ